MKIWIVRNQLGRRNLSAYDRSNLALKLKPLLAEKAKENQGTRTDILENSPKGSLTPINTRKELASIAGVSDKTLAAVEQINEHAIEPLQQKVRSGEVSIHAASAVAELPAEEQENVVNAGEGDYTPVGTAIHPAMNTLAFFVPDGKKTMQAL